MAVSPVEDLAVLTGRRAHRLLTAAGRGPRRAHRIDIELFQRSLRRSQQTQRRAGHRRGIPDRVQRPVAVTGDDELIRRVLDASRPCGQTQLFETLRNGPGSPSTRTCRVRRYRRPAPAAAWEATTCPSSSTTT